MSLQMQISSMQQMPPKLPKMPARVSPPKNFWSWVPLAERLWPLVPLVVPTSCHEMARKRMAKRVVKANQGVNKKTATPATRMKMKMTRRRKECSANSRVAPEILPHSSPIPPRKPSSRLFLVMIWVRRCSRPRTVSRRPKRSLKVTVKRRATTIPIETIQKERTVEAVGRSNMTNKIVSVAPVASTTKKDGTTETIGTTTDRKAGDEG
mmetsp:Transcript_15320/g.25514  ORF Transcript_15320/g.25514 Transcript_15320/m.25514 type:complete len:209 (+) Transcript_15320:271-897(+)